MNYKKALELVKEYSKFIGKQLHIEEHKEVITIKKIHLVEVISPINKVKSKGNSMITSLEQLDLKKDNSELLKGKNLDVTIIYEKKIITTNRSGDFNKKYPLL